MKRTYLTLFILICVTTCFAQNPEIKTDLPTVIPPSPTVAALMKFEEVPVSNYTGIPDVSVPLFNTTAKYGLDLNVALSYHPSSVKVNEVAGYTGLGWSLIAGGSISRTIRDIPDEAYVQGGMFSSKKIGIYHNDGNFAPDNNNYYQVLPLFNADYLFNLADPGMNKFLFEANEKQKFDSKHDLYQFNFMGYSGRFIIEKKPNNTYEVVKLDKNNLIINYNHTNRTFEIKDTKGFTFLFDVKELSSSHSYSIAKRINNDIEESYGVNYTDFISAFHLSKVFYNGDLVVEFIFNEGFLNEGQGSVNEVVNLPVLPQLQSILSIVQNDGENNPQAITKGILPLSTNTYTELNVKTKKITRIKITGKAKIDFNILTSGRQDTNIPASSPYLDKVTIRDWDESVRKVYQFYYDFEGKMFLNEIKEGTGPGQFSKYKFNYDKIAQDDTRYEEDYWGYLKLATNCVDLPSLKRDVDLQNCKKNVLKQIIYPTKGSAVFEYEPNTYSYVGDFPVPDNLDQLDYFESFENNPANWTVTNNAYNFTINNDLGGNYIGNETVMPTGSKTEHLGVFTTDRILTFNIDTNVLDNVQVAFLKVLKKTTAGSLVSSQSIYSGTCDPVELTLESGFDYYVKFEWTSNSELLYNNVSISERVRKPVTLRWLYGGGIRIRNIYYTDNDAPEIATQDFPDTYSRKISYDYNFFEDNTRSSGALVFPKPVMQYEMKRAFDYMATSESSPGLFAYDEIIYNVFTKANNLSFISTKGGDVGYKNVTVSETGNGRTEYEYTSPIDYPEELNSRTVVYPYAPTANIDYKRGLLTKTGRFDKTNRIVSEDSNEYEFANYDKITGITLFYLYTGCPYAAKYNNYDNYRAGVLDPNTYICGSQGGLNVICGNLLNWNVRSCGEHPSSFVGHYLLKEAFGWAKLKNTVSKEYFYDGAAQSVVQKSTDYTYNDNNMQLAANVTTFPGGDSIETKIYYPIDAAASSEPNVQSLINNNRIETPLFIQNYKNGVKISEQKSIYKNWGNNLILPELVQSAKGTQPLENRVRYSLYDTNGNPLELKQEGGTVISYIWGYNKTQPIAKIENASNAQIAAALGMAINAVNESHMTAINNLRNTLPNAMVTTYTYVPLVGVDTITDPKGDKTTYTYDELNRLKEVKDNDNNILSENQYHYKN